MVEHPLAPDAESRAGDDGAMAEALRLAEAAGRLGNVPIGAVVVLDGQVVAGAGNLRDTLQDPTAHAELLALREAARVTGSWRLTGATLVVTVEPCAMCAGAIAQARVSRLLYGTDEPKTGAVVSTRRALDGEPIVVEGGARAESCAALLTSFFEDLRARGALPESLRRDGRVVEGA